MLTTSVDEAEISSGSGVVETLPKDGGNPLPISSDGYSAESTVACKPTSKCQCPKKHLRWSKTAFVSSGHHQWTAAIQYYRVYCFKCKLEVQTRVNLGTGLPEPRDRRLPSIVYMYEHDMMSKATYRDRLRVRKAYEAQVSEIRAKLECKLAARREEE